MIKSSNIRRRHEKNSVSEGVSWWRDFDVESSELDEERHQHHLDERQSLCLCCLFVVKTGCMHYECVWWCWCWWCDLLNTVTESCVQTSWYFSRASSLQLLSQVLLLFCFFPASSSFCSCSWCYVYSSPFSIELWDYIVRDAVEADVECSQNEDVRRQSKGLDILVLSFVLF